MAVKASATITLTSYRDTQSVTRYYKLQPAGSSAPLKPETKPPSSDWTDSEPACDISKELYFCDLTIFSNGEGEYSKVSKSTSYEAAKEAYNKAQGAKDSVDNLEIGGRNYVVKEDRYSATANGITVDYNGDVYHVYGTNTKTNANYSIINWVQRYNIFEPEAVYTVSTTTPLPSGLYLGINTRNSSGTEIRAGSNSYFFGDGSKTSNTFTCTQDTNGYLSGFFGIEASCRTIDVTFKIKLEKGNKATDWTPAPEDVDAGIANAKETADSIASNIYVPNSTLLDGSKISDGSLSIDQMDDTVAGTYSDPTTKKGIMEWNGDALHIKSIDENDQNTYETVIGGDGIKFNWNGAETASINQDELRINKTVVINAMEVGNWSWAIHPTTGNLMVKWNGGE